MTQTSKTPAPQTVAAPAPATQVTNTPASTKDAGRVHMGGGVISF